MAEKKTTEKVDDLIGNSISARLVLVLALLSGAGNGIVGFTQAGDTGGGYSSGDAEKDLALRDERIAGLGAILVEQQGEIKDLKKRVQQLELSVARNHPPFR